MSKKQTIGKPYRIINEQILENCLRFITDEFINRQNSEAYKPFSVNLSEYDPNRSLPQSDLQHVWYDIAARYSDMGWSKDDFRAYCKLYIGIPILLPVRTFLRWGFTVLQKESPCFSKGRKSKRHFTRTFADNGYLG